MGSEFDQLHTAVFRNGCSWIGGDVGTLRGVDSGRVPAGGAVLGGADGVHAGDQGRVSEQHRGRPRLSRFVGGAEPGHPEVLYAARESELPAGSHHELQQAGADHADDTVSWNRFTGKVK